MKRRSKRKVNEDYIIPRLGFPIKPLKKKYKCSIYYELISDIREDKDFRVWKIGKYDDGSFK